MSFNPTNGLCSLSDLKSTLRLTDDADDDRLNLAIDAASRMIENKVNRRFWQDAAPTSRTYVCSTPFLCDVDDFFLDATAADGRPAHRGRDPGHRPLRGRLLRARPGRTPTGRASGGATAGDYQLEPLNGLSEGQPWPFERVRAVRSLLFPLWGGIAYPVPYTQALVKVTTTYGWNYVPTPIRKACILQSMALFKADDTPFGATPFAEVGIVRQQNALHPTAAALVERYREMTVRVA